jgi:hypothetical protein
VLVTRHDEQGQPGRLANLRASWQSLQPLGQNDPRLEVTRERAWLALASGTAAAAVASTVTPAAWFTVW